MSKLCYSNGFLRETDELTDSLILRTNWYETGQMRFMIQFHYGFRMHNEMTIKGVWDEKGNPRLKDGGSWCRLPSDSHDGQQPWEEGEVKGGLKQGKWVGKLEDSTVLFEEYYENGRVQRGTSFRNGEKTAYTKSFEQAEFDGGVREMYRFTARNIVYPVQAHKSRIMGKVLVSLVACEDGSLCDFEIVKGGEKSLNNEALRLVKKMKGKWKPGKQRGMDVRVKYNLPISFQL